MLGGKLMNKLDARLNRILERITADEFLAGKGLGNEIPFHAFDYPPEEELKVRQHIEFLLVQAPKRRPGLRIAKINLFQLALEMMEEASHYQKALEIQQKKGDSAVLKTLKKTLGGKLVAQEIHKRIDFEQTDLVFLSGVGNAYPMIRSHTVLNNLQPLTGETPLVLFFPGHYDGQSLQLFGRLPDTPYYRAFRLVG